MEEKGADVNCIDTGGSTPLHHSCFEADNLEVVKNLVEKGADVNWFDEDGDIPLHSAARENNYRIG